MIDHRERQIYKAMKENRAFLLGDVTQERWREIAKAMPVGSTWLWAAQAVYGPIGSATERDAAE